MIGRGAVRVSPEELHAQACAFGPERHSDEAGMARTLRLLAEAVAEHESADVAQEFGYRWAAFSVALESQRGRLRRGLESAASTYAAGETRVARELRTRS